MARKCRWIVGRPCQLSLTMYQPCNYNNKLTLFSVKQTRLASPKIISLLALISKSRSDWFQHETAYTANWWAALAWVYFSIFQINLHSLWIHHGIFCEKKTISEKTWKWVENSSTADKFSSTKFTFYSN